MLEVGKKQSLIFDLPHRLDLDVSGRISGNLDRLPEFQNVAVDVDRLLTLDVKLTDQDLRSSLGHVDDETGRRWSVAGEGNEVNGRFVPLFQGTFDRSLAVPAGHSSIWLRGAAGLSPASLVDPFANFYFGAFGNNWVDHRDEKRYRDVFSFPGASLERDRRTTLRQVDARMEPAAGSIPRVGSARLLCVMGPAVDLCRRARCTNLDRSDQRHTS